MVMSSPVTVRMTSACSVGPQSSKSAACTASMAAWDAGMHWSGGSTSRQSWCMRYTPSCIAEAATASLDRGARGATHLPGVGCVKALLSSASGKNSWS